MKEKILFLGPVPPPYMGPTVATEIILKSALKDRFQLIHLDTSDRRDLSTLGALDFQNFYLAAKHYCILLWRIVSCRPKIVYIPVSQTTIGYLKDSIFIIIAALFRRKIVCHLRGGNFRNWYQSASSLTRWYVRRVHSLVDAQIVLGERLRALFDYLMPSQRIFVVPNGRDFSRFDKKPDTQSPIKVLYLGNLIREKGALDVIRAIPAVYPKYPDVEFILAGDWTDEGVRREALEYLKQHPQLPIRLPGTVTGKSKHDLLSCADIFVFPSYYAPEGHPWVVVEAMAAGLPVISTDQGAIAEYVIDGDNGYIVDKKSPDMIAEKIAVLAGDPALRRAMGRRSRELYERNLTEEKLVERLTGVFSAVLH